MKKLLSAAVLVMSVAACQQGSPYQQAYGTNFPGPKDGMVPPVTTAAVGPMTVTDGDTFTAFASALIAQPALTGQRGVAAALTPLAGQPWQQPPAGG